MQVMTLEHKKNDFMGAPNRGISWNYAGWSLRKTKKAQSYWTNDVIDYPAIGEGFQVRALGIYMFSHLASLVLIFLI